VKYFLFFILLFFKKGRKSIKKIEKCLLSGFFIKKYTTIFSKSLAAK